MFSFFGLILLCNALIAWGLISLHYWLAYAIVGVVFGISAALFWFLGSVHQTIEFWRGPGPRWMHFLFGDPNKQRVLRHPSKQYKCNIGKLGKLESLVYGPLGTFILIHIHSIYSELPYYVAILFLITWILCICLSEIYFRRMYSKHRFTRIREDSDI